MINIPSAFWKGYIQNYCSKRNVFLPPKTGHCFKNMVKGQVHRQCPVLSQDFQQLYHDLFLSFGLFCFHWIQYRKVSLVLWDCSLTDHRWHCSEGITAIKMCKLYKLTFRSKHQIVMLVKICCTLYWMILSFKSVHFLNLCFIFSKESIGHKSSLSHFSPLHKSVLTWTNK